MILKKDTHLYEMLVKEISEKASAVEESSPSISTMMLNNAAKFGSNVGFGAGKEKNNEEAEVIDIDQSPQIA